jgi:hypothetical protein
VNATGTPGDPHATVNVTVDVATAVADVLDVVEPTSRPEAVAVG